MTADEIRELIRMAAEEGVLELEVQRGENRVRIRLDVAAAPGTVIAPPPPTADSAAPAATFAPPEKSEGATDPNLVLVKSPIVGTFYESPSPGAPPFVRVGERIQPGKVLCIIESMKLMNEIEAETAGILESKLVQNGQPIEYGEALFAIRAV
jgi:acetyl-CoA carboxylase biotin carboxyl carrier protein